MFIFGIKVSFGKTLDWIIKTSSKMLVEFMKRNTVMGEAVFSKAHELLTLSALVLILRFGHAPTQWQCEVEVHKTFGKHVA